MLREGRHFLAKTFLTDGALQLRNYPIPLESHLYVLYYIARFVLPTVGHAIAPWIYRSLFIK